MKIDALVFLFKNKKQKSLWNIYFFVSLPLHCQYAFSEMWQYNFEG